jgi:hypothetical protein
MEQLQIPPSERLRAELEALPGVHRALVDGLPCRVDLICDPATDAPPVEVNARAALLRQGLSPETTELRVSYLAEPQPRRRVRFVGVETARPRVGAVVAVVRLEWNDIVYQGEAEGEGGSAYEIRVCALATIRAMEALLRRENVFSLVGSKATRIFDHDLVTVLLSASDSPERRLIGVSLVTRGHHRSAALAVLNATNRVLGNYLFNAE